jgi:hypothetical protein
VSAGRVRQAGRSVTKKGRRARATHGRAVLPARQNEPDPETSQNSAEVLGTAPQRSRASENPHRTRSRPDHASLDAVHDRMTGNETDAPPASLPDYRPPLLKNHALVSGWTEQISPLLPLKVILLLDRYRRAHAGDAHLRLLNHGRSRWTRRGPRTVARSPPSASPRGRSARGGSPAARRAPLDRLRRRRSLLLHERPVARGGDRHHLERQDLRTSIVPNAHILGLRAGVNVAVDAGQSTDLRVFLRASSKALTRIWTFPWRS